jgi:hypothetical protein
MGHDCKSDGCCDLNDRLLGAVLALIPTWLRPTHSRRFGRLRLPNRLPTFAYLPSIYPPPTPYHHHYIRWLLKKQQLKSITISYNY